MTQQKSEDCIVPEGPRKLVKTREIETREGGKAVPGNERATQLDLFTATAAKPEVPKTKVASPKVRSSSRSSEEAPKAGDKRDREWSTTLEQATLLLAEAFEAVASNKGAPGPDRQTIDEVRMHLPAILTELEASLLDGSYAPGDIRRVWIPKSGGKLRGLGIPNVIDRIVQQAVRMVLEPLFEPTFHPSSHGFRPNRSCHTAIAEARKHIAEGFNMVVDLDLAKFFDRVCHQRLMARLAQRVPDRGLLVLIGKMLKANVIMPDGVKVQTEEGVPQGGPLSPLLSNIVLDELDWELERRGHRFVRYADDCNIFVRSERAGHRVMESVTVLIEKRLRLEVNREKSAVARPEERHFLGFSLKAHDQNEETEVNLSKRSKERLAERVVELTPRNWGSSLNACIQRLNDYLRGWIGFFGICTRVVEQTLTAMDGHIRRRLRAIQLKQWKRKRTIARKLTELGVRRAVAWRRVYEGRKSIWALSYTKVAHMGLSNAWFAEKGLMSLHELWKERKSRENVVPKQLRFWGN